MAATPAQQERSVGTAACRHQSSDGLGMLGRHEDDLAQVRGRETQPQLTTHPPAGRASPDAPARHGPARARPGLAEDLPMRPIVATAVADHHRFSGLRGRLGAGSTLHRGDPAVRAAAASTRSAAQTVGTVPPSITYSAPTMAEARSETRNPTRSATSSVVANRPSGTPPRESKMVCLAASRVSPLPSAIRSTNRS